MLEHMMLSQFFEYLVPAVHAHEKWFIPMSETAPQLPAAFQPGSGPFTAAFLAIAVVTVVGLLLDRVFERSAFYARTEARVRPLRDIAPGALALTTAILLLWSAWKGVMLADNYTVPDGALGTVMRLAEAAIGGMFLIGLNTAFAAIGLGALFFVLFYLDPSFGPLDYIYFLGIAVFLYHFARGRYSMDWFYGKPVLSSPEGRKRAYFVMRLLTGAGFLALALLKWLHPELHLDLMDRYPDWNPYVILNMIGVHFSRETYVLLLAVVETIVAIFVIGGFFTRVAAVALVPVFVGSILFLGPAELIGHLPILGILFVLFVYGDTYHKGVAGKITPLPQQK